MKKYFVKISVICILVVFLFSCAKENAEINSLSKEKIFSSKIKEWYNQNLNNSPVLLGKSMESKQIDMRRVLNEPNWESTKYYEKEAMSITTVKTKNKKINYSLVVKYVGDKIVDGFVCFVLNEMEENYMEITPSLIQGINISPSFQGAIAKYNLQGKLIDEDYFTKGIKDDRRKNNVIFVPENNVLAENNTSNLEEAPTYTCISVNYWWVVQDVQTGAILSITYLGEESICTLNGGGGSGGGNGGNGGGGGNGPSNEEVAEAATLSRLNQVQPASIFLSETDQGEGPKTRVKMYSWKCAKSTTWSIIAYDRGVHTKVNDSWRWQSLDNLSISTVGNTTGGAMTASKVFSNSVMGTYNSTSHITVNITSTVTIGTYTATNYKDITSHFTFNVNSQGMPGY